MSATKTQEGTLRARDTAVGKPGSAVSVRGWGPAVRGWGPAVKDQQGPRPRGALTGAAHGHHPLSAGERWPGRSVWGPSHVPQGRPLRRGCVHGLGRTEGRTGQCGGNARCCWRHGRTRVGAGAAPQGRHPNSGWGPGLHRGGGVSSQSSMKTKMGENVVLSLKITAGHVFTFQALEQD